MNKTLIAVLVVIAASGLTAWYLWLSNNRFTVVNGPRGIAYEIDRRTGESWMLAGGKKTPHSAPTTNRGKPLPYEAAAKVQGQATLWDSQDDIRINLYNGSAYHITGFVIHLSVENKDGSPRWARDYVVEDTTPPLSQGYVSVDVGDLNDHGKWSWQMRDLVGYRLND